MVAVFNQFAATAFEQVLNLEIGWLVGTGLVNESEARHLTLNQVYGNEPRIQDPILTFRKFCTNSQNRGGSRYLLDSRGWDLLGRHVLYEYNYNTIAAQYPWDLDNVGPQLSEALCASTLAAHLNHGQILRGNVQLHIRRLQEHGTSRSAWRRLLSTIQHAATVFATRSGHSLAPPAWNLIVGKISTIEPAHLKISQIVDAIAPFVKIRNIGHPLAANFLKDIGIQNLFKADTHTLKVTGYAFRLCEQPFPEKEDGILHSTENALAFSIAAGVTLASVDRLMWLAGSGEWYQFRVGAILPQSERLDRIREIARILRQAVAHPDQR